jgi:hypothetical protein
LVADCLFASEVDASKLKILLLETLIISNWVLDIEDKIQLIGLGQLGLLLHIKEL